MATAADIARVRRMVAEPDNSNGYTDAVLGETIERYPVLDAADYAPDDDAWTATYDLNAAAADVWGEKAAGLVGGYDFSADGSSFSRSQAHAQAARMQRYYAARRKLGTITLIRARDSETETEAADL